MNDFIRSMIARALYERANGKGTERPYADFDEKCSNGGE